MEATTESCLVFGGSEGSLIEMPLDGRVRRSSATRVARPLPATQARLRGRLLGSGSGSAWSSRAAIAAVLARGDLSRRACLSALAGQLRLTATAVRGQVRRRRRGERG